MTNGPMDVWNDIGGYDNDQSGLGLYYLYGYITSMVIYGLYGLYDLAYGIDAMVSYPGPGDERSILCSGPTVCLCVPGYTVCLPSCGCPCLLSDCRYTTVSLARCWGPASLTLA